MEIVGLLLARGNVGFNPNDTALIMVCGCLGLDNLSHVASSGGYVGTVLVLLKDEGVGPNATTGEGGEHHYMVL